MLIFAGADLVGKTTITKAAVKLLNEEFDLPHMYMHLGRPPESFDYYGQYMDMCSVATVWDRFHIDCLPYRACDDHLVTMTPLKYSLVDASITMLGGRRVVVTADEEVIRTRHSQRDDDLYSLDHILKVNQEFASLVTNGNYMMRGDLYRPIIEDVIHIDKHEYDVNECVRPIVQAYVKNLDELVNL